jgi:hypothetical protein
MRRGNLYGLDVKLTPEGRPYTIELNGTDSGTNSFAYEEGFGFYDFFLRTLYEKNGHRPLFLQVWETPPLTALENRILAGRVSRDYARRQTLARDVGEIFSALRPDLEFRSEWIEDLGTFQSGRYGLPSDHEDRYVKHAAKKTGIPVHFFTSLRCSSGKISFQCDDGRTRTMRPDDIGAVRAISTTLKQVPEAYIEPFLNIPFMEYVLDSKPFTHFIGKLHDPFRELMPRSVPHGLGVGSRGKTARFLRDLDGQYVVRKRGSSYCGTGVEILERQPLLDQIRAQPRHVLDRTRAKEQLAAMNFLLSQGALGEVSMCGFPIEEYVSMYEEFIPSIGLPHPQTKELHDGCARVMIFSPWIGEPVVLGAQWRLATHPQHGDHALTDKYRANLSRGATAAPISLKHERILFPHALRSVREFEQAAFNAQLLCDDLRSNQAIKHAGAKELPDQKFFKLLFWTHHLAERVSRLTQRLGGNEHPDSFVARLHALDEKYASQLIEPGRC